MENITKFGDYETEISNPKNFNLDNTLSGFVWVLETKDTNRQNNHTSYSIMVYSNLNSALSQLEYKIENSNTTDKKVYPKAIGENLFFNWYFTEKNTIEFTLYLSVICN